MNCQLSRNSLLFFLIAFSIIYFPSSVYCVAEYVSTSIYTGKNCSGALYSIEARLTACDGKGSYFICTENMVAQYTCAVRNCSSECSVVQKTNYSCSESEGLSVQFTCGNLPPIPAAYAVNYNWLLNSDCSGPANEILVLSDIMCSYQNEIYTSASCSGAVATVLSCPYSNCSTGCTSSIMPTTCEPNGSIWECTTTPSNSASNTISSSSSSSNGGTINSSGISSSSIASTNLSNLFLVSATLLSSLLVSLSSLFLVEINSRIIFE